MKIMRKIYGRLPKEEIPEWAKFGRFRYSRYDGGAVEVVKAALSGWEYMSHPDSVLATTHTYDEEMIEILKMAYINWIWVTWSVGFSLEAEAQQRKILKPFVARCKKEGIHASAYLSLVNMFAENMAKDVPESVEWRQVDEEGNFVPYGAAVYVGEPTRFLACLNHPGWIDYLMRRVDTVLEADFDAIHYDNLQFHNCYCQRCQGGFAKYTKEILGKEYKLPSRKVIKETRQAALEALEVEPGEETYEDEEARQITLLAQEYRELRIAGLLANIKEYCRKRRPLFQIYANAHQRPLTANPNTGLWTEDGYAPGILDGKLITNLGLYRYLHADGDGWKPIRVEHSSKDAGVPRGRLEAQMPPRQHARSIVEAMASCAGFCHFVEGNFLAGLYLGDKASIQNWRFAGRYNAFLEEHEVYYVDTYPLARILVIVNDVTKREFLNTLTRRGFQYLIVLETHLEEGSLNGFEVVILPDVRYTADSTVEIIREYVRGGGKLIATNLTSLYDEKFGRRRDFALADVFGISAGMKLSGPVRNDFGKGRSIFYPGALERIVLEDDQKRAELAEEIKRLEGKPIISLEAPDGVLATLTKKKDTNSAYIHLINYADEDAKDIKITLRLADGPGNRPGRAGWELLSPDENIGELEGTKAADGAIEFHLTGLSIYGLIAIDHRL